MSRRVRARNPSSRKSTRSGAAPYIDACTGMRYAAAWFGRFVIVARNGCTSTEIRAECEPIRRSESLSPWPIRIRTPQPSRRTSIRPAIDCTRRRAPSRDSGASRSPAPGGPSFASTMATRMTSIRSTTTGTERKRWRCRLPRTPIPAFARWRLGRFPKRRQYGWYPPDPIWSKPDLLVRPHHDREKERMMEYTAVVKEEGDWWIGWLGVGPPN